MDDMDGLMLMFQSTHPHGVRPSGTEVTPEDIQFQSTHPHGVRHRQNTSSHDLVEVSIHAPTRGATYRDLYQDGQDTVSIHAPTRGATIITYHAFRLICFNPRTHTGCDTYEIVGRSGLPVSIHAPTRGATYDSFVDYADNGRFQSTHPHGVRPLIPCSQYKKFMFQSTHPHGVRH